MMYHLFLSIVGFGLLFYWDFCMHVHQGDGLYYFFCYTLVWFQYQGIIGLAEIVGQSSFFFVWSIWWFEWEMHTHTPEAHTFEHLAPSWWHRSGRFRWWSCAGGSALGVGFESLGPHPASNSLAGSPLSSLSLFSSPLLSPLPFPPLPSSPLPSALC